MSKSFALVGGDLALGSGLSFQTVSGKDKLAQDLKLWILERVGTDPATPTFGSTLDGGIQNGIVIPSYIGQIVNEDVLTKVRADVINLLQRYQTMQYEKMRSETLAYLGQTTLEEGEVIQNITRVAAKAIGTTILVQAVITVLDGSQMKITIPVGGTGA